MKMTAKGKGVVAPFLQEDTAVYFAYELMKLILS